MNAMYHYYMIHRDYVQYLDCFTWCLTVSEFPNEEPGLEIHFLKHLSDIF